MRKFPVFTKKEIKYIKELVMSSESELISNPGQAWKDFSPFKNDLANKLTKYDHVIDERIPKCKRCKWLPVYKLDLCTECFEKYIENSERQN